MFELTIEVNATGPILLALKSPNDHSVGIFEACAIVGARRFGGPCSNSQILDEHQFLMFRSV